MSNAEQNPGRYPDPVPGGDENTRRWGRFKLFPYWLTRNLHWDRDVINWLGTRQGHDELRSMFDTFHGERVVYTLVFESLCL